MKIPEYIFKVKTEKEWILANPLNRSVVQLDTDFWHRMNQNPQQLTKEEVASCVELGFLVPDSMNEDQYIQYQLEKTRLKHDELSLYIMLSTLCNFKCIYCYECNQVKMMTMPEETQQKMIEWIEGVLENEHCRKLKIDLYGGEPTLFFDRFLALLEQLKIICQKRKIQLQVNMVSNGYLLTYDMLKKLSKYYLNEIHISLDGPKEIHDKRSPLKTGQGTFDKIFSLLKEIGKHKTKFKVIVRMGIDASNINQLEPLVKQLKKINKKGNLYPYVSPITETTSGNSCNNCGKNNLLTLDTQIEAYKKCYDLLYKYGFDIPDFHTYGPCMVLSNSSMVIYPNGDLYKCLDMVGLKQYIIGNIFQKEWTPYFYEFMNAPHLKYCYQRKCPYISICGGGCLVKAMVNNEKFDKPDCPFKVIEELTHYLLRKKYATE